MTGLPLPKSAALKSAYTNGSARHRAESLERYANRKVFLDLTPSAPVTSPRRARIGILLSMALRLSLISPSRADRFVDSLAGPHHEYKIVLGTVLLATVFAFVAAIGASKWWYIGAALSSGTLAFFTTGLSSYPW
jgi:hypothetical protein